MEYNYYDMSNDLVRMKDFWGDIEFYRNGQWVKDEKRALNVRDALMGYGDYSRSDIDDLTEEQAMKMMEK